MNSRIGVPNAGEHIGNGISGGHFILLKIKANLDNPVDKRRADKSAHGKCYGSP